MKNKFKILVLEIKSSLISILIGVYYYYFFLVDGEKLKVFLNFDLFSIFALITLFLNFLSSVVFGYLKGNDGKGFNSLAVSINFSVFISYTLFFVFYYSLQGVREIFFLGTLFISYFCYKTITNKIKED